MIESLTITLVLAALGAAPICYGISAAIYAMETSPSIARLRFRRAFGTTDWRLPQVRVQLVAASNAIVPPWKRVEAILNNLHQRIDNAILKVSSLRGSLVVYLAREGKLIIQAELAVLQTRRAVRAFSRLQAVEVAYVYNKPFLTTQ